MAPPNHRGGRPAPDSLWALLTDAEREVLLACGVEESYGAREEVLHEGDTSRSVHVVLEGRVKVVAASTRGCGHVLAVRRAGDVLGELAAIDGKPRTATVTAVDDLTVLRVPADRFTSALRANPGIALALLAVMCGRLRTATRRRTEFGDSTTAQRLASLLSELADEHGAAHADGVAITLPFSQEELAGSIASSRKAVVRALRALRDEGIVATARQRVVVLRPDALRRRSAATWEPEPAGTTRSGRGRR
ncbi:Crp/Fnr family transcriptional regulator [Saccharothrix sp. Mg75]|uniref:Crp/Fnr family transcriptional regulator n=1 Tax=Saccharothrix sp. Mg75 TaxID=3445357 RepID=UPI003EEF70BD